jgi:hypothetical protein
VLTGAGTGGRGLKRWAGRNRPAPARLQPPPRRSAPSPLSHSSPPAPPTQAFYRLTDYSSQIRAYVFDVVRASVPKILLDDVFLVGGLGVGGWGLGGGDD